MAKRHSNIIIVRSFVVSVTFVDGRELTTTATGSNAYAAEENYRREHPTAVRVIVRSEIR